MSLRMEAVLAARDVAVTLDVATGETVAVLGPNGAGKSTLLGMIAGLVRPDSGVATLGDGVLFDLPKTWTPPHRRGIALLAQEPLLFPHLSVRHNVAFGPRSAGVPRTEARAAAERWLAETGATEFADRHPFELSGGQAQRVAIARALAAEPGLLLLDEPLSALDVTVTSEVRRMLARVLADRTAVFVSHNALDAYLLADRVIVMHDGRIVEQGPTRAVLERPRRPFTAELVGVTLLTGRRTPTGLVTDDGRAIAATPAEAAALDARVAATLRPAEVRIEGAGRASRPADSAADSAAENRIPAIVRDLEPRGDLIRVRTNSYPALASPAVVADLALSPGTPVTLTFPATAVTLYPA
ncbi:sulfate/molybdate ABC transporter ATP-binding protein [Leifsonia sp. NPDC058292]|uniref:sulfate/molybdate ABC transporter ATP-binding protein n=1 Tax=Leifsonia sp. NPDC058292 TaxID=3346428 RepID=UPI0036DE0037